MAPFFTTFSVLLFLVYVPLLSVAIERAAVHRNVCVPSWLRGRIKAVKPRSTIAGHVTRSLARRKALGRMLEHYKSLEQRVDYTRGTKCANEGKYALNSVANLVRYFGWGDFFGCYTKLIAEEDPSQLFESLAILRAASARAGNALLKKGAPGSAPGKWFKNGATENGFFEYNDDRVFSRCVIARSLAYRVKSTWKVALDFTNAPQDVELADWKRTYYTEAVYLDAGGKVALNQPFNVRNCTTDKNSTAQSGNASVSLWAGSPKWSAFLTSDLEDNPALQRILHSLNDNDYVKGQVEESYRPSSIAILILPSIYALVPVSFFSNIDDVCSVLYVVLADLCSVIPTLIKGVELLTFYNRKRHTTISYVYGHPDSPVMAAETWVSSCQLSGTVRATGIGLIVWALAAFVLGFLFEKMARWRMMKDRKIWNDVLTSYFREKEPELLSASSRFISKYFEENAVGGMFWYFGAARVITRLDNRRENSKWELFKRKVTDSCFRSHTNDFVVQHAYDKEGLSPAETNQNQITIFQRIKF